MESKEQLDLLLAEKGILKEVRELEIALKDKEIELEKVKKSTQQNSLQKGILIALIGLFATLLASTFEGFYSRRIEKDKFESQLIMNAVDNNNVYDRIDKIEFILASKLVSGANYRNLKTLLMPESAEDLPAILKVFEGSDVTNFEMPYSLRIGFNPEWTVDSNQLKVRLDDIVLLQSKERPNGSDATIVTKLELALAYHVDKARGEWDIMATSSPFEINKTIEIKQEVHLGPHEFTIDISGIDKDREYFLVLLVYNYDNVSRVEGYTPAFFGYDISLEPKRDVHNQ